MTAELITSEPMTSKRGQPWLFWLVVCLIGFIFAGTTGRLEPHVVPDTPSYTQYPLHDFVAALESIRTPGYPLILASMRLLTGDEQWVPWFQCILFAIAAIALSHELKAWDVSLWARRATALAVAFGCTASDHVHTLATDAPAAALGVLTSVALMRWGRNPSSFASATWLVLLAVFTISLRPAFLFLIPWCGVASLLLLRLRSYSLRRALVPSACLMLSVLAPMVAWCFLRFAVVNDFGVAPFGGQNLAGVLVQLVSDEELLALPEPSAMLAQSILVHRDAIKGSSEWQEGDPYAYMTREARWHDVTWRAVVPGAVAIVGAETIKSHRAIQQLNRDILKAYPLRYAYWYGSAIRRGMWGTAADLVMHPLFLALIGLWLLVVCMTSLLGIEWPSPQWNRGYQVYVTVALSYFLCKLLFVCLSSPPIGRFMDAAAILLPGCCLIPLVDWLQMLFRKPVSSVCASVSEKT